MPLNLYIATTYDVVYDRPKTCDADFFYTLLDALEQAGIDVLATDPGNTAGEYEVDRSDLENFLGQLREAQLLPNDKISIAADRIPDAVAFLEEALKMAPIGADDIHFAVL